MPDIEPVKTEELRFVQYLPGFAIVRTINECDDMAIGYAGSPDMFFTGADDKLYFVEVSWFLTNDAAREFVDYSDYNNFFNVTVIHL